MTLVEEILRLRARALAELSAAHDYFADTKLAWKIVRRSIRTGAEFAIRNKATKTVTTDSSLVEKSKEYVTRYLAEATFQQFVSIFENHFFDLLRLWLVAHPQSLGTKELSFKTVLDAPNKEAITLQVVDKELNDIAYERPKEWFKYLDSRVKLGCPTEDEIDRIGEIKASRDVLAHNRGVVNKIYLSKAGRFARFADAETLEISEQYHAESWELFRKVISDVFDATAAKAE